MKKYERKFLINILPDMHNIQPVIYERYWIYIRKDEHVKVQKRGNTCEIESVFGNYKQKILITKSAFDELTKDCDKCIKRENYLLPNNIKVKIYKGIYSGLSIADIEFLNYEQYLSFKKPDWLGSEITSTPLGKDTSIVQLSSEEVLKTISIFKQNEDLAKK